MSPQAVNRLAPWVATAGLLILWEAACRIFRIDEFVLPAPSVSLEALWEYRDAIWFNAFFTLWVTLAGCAIAVDGQDQVGLEIAGIVGPLWFAGEYVDADIDSPVSGNLAFDGYYVQVGYFLTGESRGYKASEAAFDRTKPNRNFDGSGGTGAWEVALRYSATDLDDRGARGGVLDGIAAGVNWYPNPVTRLMLNWVHTKREAAGDADFLLIRAQIDF